MIKTRKIKKPDRRKKPRGASRRRDDKRVTLLAQIERARQILKEKDVQICLDEDPRKTALKDELRQLRKYELRRLISHIVFGRPVLLDRDEHGNANYCPLAVAIDFENLPFEFGYRSKPWDTIVAEFLTGDCGFTIYNTRGIAGEFYTTNRREDLLLAAREVMAER